MDRGDGLPNLMIIGEPTVSCPPMDELYGV